MLKAWSASNSKGFLTVEALLAASLFGILAIGLIGAFIYGEESTKLSGNRARASMMAEEGLEAVRNIRDAGYTNLADGTYGLIQSGNQWIFSGTQDTSGIFTRQIIISSVDTKRKSVTANVTWQQNLQRQGSVSMATRLTYWMEAAGGVWSNPIFVTDLPISGNNNGTKIKLSGNYAFMIRDDGSPDFVAINVTDPTSPSIAGSLSLTGTPTNIAISGNFAYVSNTDNSQELQIINISNPASPTLAGSFNAAGNADANGVFAVGTTVYLTQSSSANPEFLIINAATPASPTLVGSLELGAKANEVVVSGNYAYVASDSDSQEMQVINIATPATPILAASLNLAGSTNAESIARTGTTVLLSQGNNLYTVNVANPIAPSLLGGVDTGGNVNDIDPSADGTTAFIADSNRTAEFQVADLSILATPTIVGTVNISGNSALLGIVYDATQNRVYAAGDPNNAEFNVFAPQ